MAAEEASFRTEILSMSFGSILYILNVEGSTRYPIHDIEYLIPTARPFASDIELSTFHGVTTIVLDGDTGHTTLKHISQICRARLQALVNIHSGDRG